VTRKSCLLLSLTLVALPILAADSPRAAELEAAVEAVIDDFHQAASEADEERYLGHLAATGVFLGTDASERWTKEAFREFVHPYFSDGKGWTFVPVKRYVSVSADGTAAWFDEHLESESYGTCRGSGALQVIDGVWKIEQYNLTIPVPNDLAKDLVARIRAMSK
jgi:ketosteroid isomerase-like protein